jgi:C4-dicarboxylate transporter DctM subunit
MFIGIFLIFVVIGIPLAFSFGLSSLLFMVFAGLPLSTLVSRSFGALDSWPLMAVPLFILVGDLMGQGGLSYVLINFVQVLVGRIRGSLAHIMVISCLFFGAISGSSAATVAAIGTIMIPEMEKRGYQKNFCAAVAASSGFLGILIPPSIPLIIYGITASVSVGALFLGGIVPGLLMAVGFMLVNYFISDKYKDKPDNGQIDNSGDAEQLSQQDTWNAVIKAIPALLLPVLILGGIYAGIFTPTEAGAVAVVYGFLAGAFYYRSIRLKNLLPILSKAALTSITILFIIAMAGPFGWILTTQRVPVAVINLITNISQSPVVIILLMNAFFLVLGMIMETVTAIVITTPIFLPLALMIGMDPVHFGVMMIVNLCVGLITPPMALNLLIASRIADVGVNKIMKPLLPYLAVSLIVLALVTFIPSLSLFLPRLLLK